MVNDLSLFDAYAKLDSWTNHFEEEGNDMILSRSNYFKYNLQWLEDSLIKVEAKRSKKNFQSLIMEV